VIKGCACGMYGIRADLVATRRLKAPPPGERNKLQAEIQALHAKSQEAGVDTETEDSPGPLVVTAGKARLALRGRAERLAPDLVKAAPAGR
jgi:hypothetical protein